MIPAENAPGRCPIAGRKGVRGCARAGSHRRSRAICPVRSGRASHRATAAVGCSPVAGAWAVAPGLLCSAASRRFRPLRPVAARRREPLPVLSPAKHVRASLSVGWSGTAESRRFLGPCTPDHQMAEIPLLCCEQLGCPCAINAGARKNPLAQLRRACLIDDTAGELTGVASRDQRLKSHWRGGVSHMSLVARALGSRALCGRSLGGGDEPPVTVSRSWSVGHGREIERWWLPRRAPVAEPGVHLAVFGDALASCFSGWSWVRHDLSVTEQVHSSTRFIEVCPGAGLCSHRTSQGGRPAAVELWVHAGAKASTSPCLSSRARRSWPRSSADRVWGKPGPARCRHVRRDAHHVELRTVAQSKCAIALHYWS